MNHQMHSITETEPINDAASAVAQTTENLASNIKKTWRDKKKYLWLSSTFVFLLPLLSPYLYSVTGHEYHFWLGPIVIHAVIPLLDYLIGLDLENPPEEAVENLESQKYYRYILYASVPIQYFSLIFCTWFLATHDLSWFAYLGFALTVGTFGGLAINTGHEMGHKLNQVDHWLAKFALAQTFYTHFIIEHNRGHHVRVATPEDPASARFNETFYSFLPRTVMGGIKSSIHLEKKRLEQKQLSFWSVHNILLQGWLISTILYVGLVAAFGWGVLLFVLIQGAYGASLLEVVNYIEHYGLKRQNLKMVDMSVVSPSILGTAIISSLIYCYTNCNDIRIIMQTQRVPINRCAILRSRHNCLLAMLQ